MSTAEARPQLGWIRSTPAAACLGVVLSMLLVALGFIIQTGTTHFLTTPEYARIAIGVPLLIATAAAVIDIRSLRLLDRFTASIAAFAAVQIPALSAGAITQMWVPPLAAAIVGAVYLVLGLTGNVGFGDVKFGAALALAVGAAVGMAAVFIVPIAVIVGAVQRLAQLAIGKTGPRPHGVALVVAAVAVVGLHVLVTTGGM